MNITPPEISLEQYGNTIVNIASAMAVAVIISKLLKPTSVLTTTSNKPYKRTLGKGKMTILEIEDLPIPYDLQPTILKLYLDNDMESKPVCLPIGFHSLDVLKSREVAFHVTGQLGVALPTGFAVQFSTCPDPHNEKAYTDVVKGPTLECRSGSLVRSVIVRPSCP